MPNNDLEIINNLRKDITDIKIFTRKVFEGYKRKELEFRYLTKGSQLEKETKENKHREGNAFWYTAGEEKIDELAKKDPMEIFDFLVPKHLERNEGYGESIGKEPKRFKSPCYLCNQKSLTTLGYSEEGYPDELERFYCRLCRTSFGWIDIKEDPTELQEEMKGYYKVFKHKEIEKNLQRLEELSKEAEVIKKNLERDINFFK